jgi:hypothetical protein
MENFPSKKTDRAAGSENSGNTLAMKRTRRDGLWRWS